LSVEVARGVIQVQGVYQVTEDLTPEDLTELPPEDVQVGFHGELQHPLSAERLHESRTAARFDH
jgi:hypothetical protein